MSLQLYRDPACHISPSLHVHGLSHMPEHWCHHF